MKKVVAIVALTLAVSAHSAEKTESDVFWVNGVIGYEEGAKITLNAQSTQFPVNTVRIEKLADRRYPTAIPTQFDDQEDKKWLYANMTEINAAIAEYWRDCEEGRVRRK